MSRQPGNNNHPALDVRDAANELLGRNDRTVGAEVGEIYLGKDVLVVTVRRPVVIEGVCRDAPRTIDLFDLMDMHAAETAAGASDEENNRLG